MPLTGASYQPAEVREKAARLNPRTASGPTGSAERFGGPRVRG